MGGFPVIMVTGGTGFVGRHLVRELVNQGYPVRAFVRNIPKAREILPENVELVKGDITDRDSLNKACEGINTVINLVSIIRETDELTYEKVNVEGILNAVISSEQAGVKRFIHLSALGAHDNALYRYTYSKWLGEEAIKQSGLNWVILRPSVIYGCGFNFFDRLLQAVKLFPPPFVPVPGRGTTLFQPIAVEDVVKCLIKALKSPAMSGQVYEIGGPEHLSYNQMLEMLLQVEDIKRVKLKIPMFLMNMIVPFMTKLLKDPPVTPEELKQLHNDNITELDSVPRHFGFKPKPLSQGLKNPVPAGK
jgi:NADH dehydrogenase